ncbi:3-oxoacyl-[acyl-carrier protein] reductase [Tepidamorphus gemmatus]|uniref:3-oxoacyl-[acyl-carrier protein] reductase n=1 Tax=Tepidamorphus gemmatus TaxID=747076 RepID=A0A4R3M8A4_9HYPH|nr:SDR family oxidoreductase [Tepidamorphus gemmatus]TCT09332.1 3-oxoacyl-[acyl-carrier protein] reductase [Tepidamorphus gemmatus]
MDLGIRGRTAIVCGGSKGLGRGSAEKLAEAGVAIVLNARSHGPLEQAAGEIAERYGVQVTPVAADVTTPEGRARLLEAAPAPDILITNAGGPPPGMWHDWGEAEWQAAIRANMLTPIHLITAVLPGMIERRWGRIVNITSGSVKAPIPELGLSGAARSGLTGFVAGTSRQVARFGVTINNLLPGQHETARIESLMANVARTRGISVEEARAEAYAKNPTGRFGTTEEFGAMCAFLCSAYAGYIVGQNILLDGGAINSTL